MTVDSQAGAAVEVPAVATRSARPHPADLLLPVSLGLWAFGVARTDASHLGPYGLPGVLPVVFYVGVGLLVVSAAAELATRRPSRARMALHAIALVVMLYGTAPLVYAEGRYSWLYKTVGVVQYVNSHGQLDRSIDIYQNWPGFFALAAWFDKVAGVASPLAYAKWAQLLFELAALPLLYLAYSALSLPVRQRWIALLIYSSANWIAQDYFSPQALGTVLSIGVMAIVLRWMFVGNSAGRRAHRFWKLHLASRQKAADKPPDGTARSSWKLRLPALRRSRQPANSQPADSQPADSQPADSQPADSQPADSQPADSQPAEQPASGRSSWQVALLAALVVVFFVLTFSHELSPYIVLVQLGVLAAAGLLRPRWLPLLLAAVAVGYLLPRFGYVNTHYGLLSSIGDFFSNASPPSASAPLPVPVSEHLIQRSAEALSLVVWLLSVAGAFRRRRSRRTVLALMLLAYSPVVVLLLGAYGNEGILRVYLFSLPWAAALAAAAVAPLPRLQRRARSHARRLSFFQAVRTRLARGALNVPVVLAVTVTLFFPAFFGNDRAYVVSQAEVTTITDFLQAAPPGVLFMAGTGGPGADTGRYNLFPGAVVFGPGGVAPSGQAGGDIAAVIARTAENYTDGNAPAYVIVSPSMMSYNEAFPATPQSNFGVLLASLARSGYWQLIADYQGTVIYQLPVGQIDIGPGPAAQHVTFSVP